MKIKRLESAVGNFFVAAGCNCCCCNCCCEELEPVEESDSTAVA
ncbi:MAG: hypothetical protein AAF363_02245 [Bacteroidota bacterium]